MKLQHGCCLEKLKSHKSDSVDSLITDPPAGISFMGKDWDGDKGDRDTWILWLRTIMKECYRVMKPGAHGLVWAIPRTSHWTATALEDAGFEIRDVVTHLFGSGFPKSLDVSKAIDKAAGAKREKKDQTQIAGNRMIAQTIHAVCNICGKRQFSGNACKCPDPSKNAVTDDAKQWSGWGTALKPASEHWILIRKPCSEKTVAKNVLKWGVGGINIDGCRIGISQEDIETINKKSNEPGRSDQPIYGKYKKAWSKPANNQGRFPANLVLDEIAAGMLDEQSGHIKSGGQNYSSNAESMFGTNKNFSPSRFAGDSGGASRFFYVAKASKKDRGENNIHPTVKASKLMEYLITLITPPNGIVLDPFMGSGSTGVAAKRLGFKFVGIEKEKEYFEIAEKRMHAQQ